MANQIKNTFGEIFDGYEGGEEMPLGGYAVLLGVFNAALAVMLASIEEDESQARNSKFTIENFLLLSAATYKISRLISRDRVTSPIRAPFVKYIEPNGADEVREEVRGEGLQRAVGDWLHCPFCLSPWVAAALGFGFILKPRKTKFLGTIFAAVAVADIFQHGYNYLKEKGE